MHLLPSAVKGAPLTALGTWCTFYRAWRKVYVFPLLAQGVAQALFSRLVPTITCQSIKIILYEATVNLFFSFSYFISGYSSVPCRVFNFPMSIITRWNSALAILITSYPTIFLKNDIEIAKLWHEYHNNERKSQSCILYWHSIFLSRPKWQRSLLNLLSPFWQYCKRR